MSVEQKNLETVKGKLESLRTEVLATAFSFIERIKNKVNPPTPEEKNAHYEMQEQLKVIEKVFTDMMKTARMEGRPASNTEPAFDQKVFDRLKEMGSSIGEISQSVPTS